MKRSILTFFLAFICLIVSGQGPTVPSRITVAGINLKINDAARKNIQNDVNMLTRHHSYYMNKVERARTYFPIIERIFAEEGVPDDIKFLVLQESELISDAVSTSDAVGFWQMKDFTAMELGLRVDRHIDERKNIVSSTYGAARYLKRSQETFDNWINSLQSYQMGIGGAERALGDKYRGDRSMNITMKTYWYVRKYLAHVIAFRDIVEQTPKEGVGEYTFGEGKSFGEVAKDTGISTEELKKYNTWWRNGRLPEDKTFTVIVPGDYEVPEHLLSSTELETVDTTAPLFSNQSDLFPKIKEDKYRDHKHIIGVNGLPAIIASSTDNAITLAQKGEVSLEKFLKYNDLKNSHVQAGQVYYLKRKKGKAGTHYHSLEPGETLWQVSQKYGLRLDRLITKNRLTAHEMNSLKPGRVLWLRFIRPADTPIEYSKIQELVIEAEDSLATTEQIVIEAEGEEDVPVQKEEVAEDLSGESPVSEMEYTEEDKDEEVLPSVMTFHTIVKGDTYYSLAKKYNVTVLEILEWNDRAISSKLSIGEKLKIHSPVNQNDSGFTTHTVKPGETLYSLSKEYGVSVTEIMEWNNKKDAALRVGEKIKIMNSR